MDKNFKKIVEALHPSFECLIEMKPVQYSTLPKGKLVPTAGIYLLSEKDGHLYVGRSNRLRERICNHCKLSATHRMAAFAFNLAREQTNNPKASYKKGEKSRQGLMENEEFKKAFDLAKSRIRKMDIRYVTESDPTTQALLEMYAAVALNTKYNDFDTH